MDMHRQAEAFGAVFYSGSANTLKKDGSVFTVGFVDRSEKKAAAVIIATGSRPRRMDIPGEKEFAGRGVSYCATCDGPFFKGKKMLVVGGGDAACDEARYLSRLTDHVTLVHRRDSFRAQRALVERTMSNPNIKVRLNTIIKEIKGEKNVKSVILTDTRTGETCEEETDAVFIFTGTVPQTSLVSDNGLAKLDENGYIITNQKLAADTPGLFAAGDVRSGAFRQVVTAAADGAIAANNAAEYVENLTVR
jgi:thioredoxin reductase (NADPH)